jgi:dihydrofolate reductase
VIGGAEIFRLALPFAERVELTEVLAEVEGDTVMPDPRESAFWRETFREEHGAEGKSLPYAFVTLERA